MCNWDAFPIDSPKAVCNHEQSSREKYFHSLVRSNCDDRKTVTTTPSELSSKGINFPVDHVRALLDTVQKGVVVTDREGRVLMVNSLARKHLASYGTDEMLPVNIFRELLLVDPSEISRRIESGENEIDLRGRTAIRPYRVMIRWIPESDWLAIQFAGDDE